MKGYKGDELKSMKIKKALNLNRSLQIQWPGMNFRKKQNPENMDIVMYLSMTAIAATRRKGLRI